jgi:hypothetical protein
MNTEDESFITVMPLHKRGVKQKSNRRLVRRLHRWAQIAGAKNFRRTAQSAAREFIGLPPEMARPFTLRSRMFTGLEVPHFHSAHHPGGLRWPA